MTYRLEITGLEANVLGPDGYTRRLREFVVQSGACDVVGGDVETRYLDFMDVEVHQVVFHSCTWTGRQ